MVATSLKAVVSFHRGRASLLPGKSGRKKFNLAGILQYIMYQYKSHDNYRNLKYVFWRTFAKNGEKSGQAIA